MGLPDYNDEEAMLEYKLQKKLAVAREEANYLAKNLKDSRIRSDGSTASYYELPTNCKELQDLISAKNMNAQIGEIFRECYRYGQASHSDELRGIKKILFYANAELKRLENVDS
jgi:hypothetical protein